MGSESWFSGVFMLTLPCNRAAAIAALEAAIASAKRSLWSTGIISVFMGLVVFGFFIGSTGLPSIAPIILFFFLAVVLVIPIINYMEIAPWIKYLEELKRGLETGTISVEEVCGQPIYWGRRRIPQKP